MSILAFKYLGIKSGIPPCTRGSPFKSDGDGEPTTVGCWAIMCKVCLHMRRKSNLSIFPL